MKSMRLLRLIINQVFLPKHSPDKPVIVAFLNTGAYQESLSGYGGIKHCLIPSPKLIVIDRDEKGNFQDSVYRNEQTVDEMLQETTSLKR